LNRVEEAEATAKEAHAKGLDSRLAPVLYGIAFYRDDTSEMARQAASAAGNAVDEELLLALQADTAAYFGHLRKAREFSRQAADSAGRAGEKETAATYYAASALRKRCSETQTEQDNKPFSRRDVRLGEIWITAWRWPLPMQGTQARRKPWLMI
jgi:hypothetical protein